MCKISFDASCSDFYVFFLHLMPETGQPKPWKIGKTHITRTRSQIHVIHTRRTYCHTTHAHSVGKSFYYHIAIKKITQNSFFLSANKITKSILSISISLDLYFQVKNILLEHAFEVSSFLFFVGPMTLICVLYVLIGVKLRKSKLLQGVKRRSCEFGRGISGQTRVIRMLGKFRSDISGSASNQPIF